MSPIANKQSPAAHRASPAVVAFAFFQVESALWVAIILLLFFFYPKPFPWWNGWLWAILGLCGEAALVLATIWDRTSAEYVQAKQFGEKLDPHRIRRSDYRHLIQEALTYRYRAHLKTEPLSSRYHERMRRLDELLLVVYQLAAFLGQYQRDASFKRKQRDIPLDLQHAKARSKLERDERAKSDIDARMKELESRLGNLQELSSLASRAELVLQDSVTTLKTAYTQLAEASDADLVTQDTSMAESIDIALESVQETLARLQELYQSLI